MKAAQVSEFGPIDRISIVESRTPDLRDGTVRVRNTVAGVNFADVGMVLGGQRRREPPFTPGVEAAGRIDAVAEDVDLPDLATNGRVVYWDPMPAAFADYAVVDAWRCVPVPDDIPDEVAVALMVQGATAQYLTTAASSLSSGKTCLVYSAAGGVGHLILQIAVMLGARPIAVVGSSDKVEIARHFGAETVINRRSDDVLQATLEATGGNGADAVYDAVGAETIEQSLRATRNGGTCILYGAASGAAGELDETLTGRVAFKRTGLGAYLGDGEAYRARLGRLFEWVRAGSVTPRIGGEWLLDETAQALQAIAGGQTTGKLVIRIP
jgi:NADPH2:quinone reductase